MQKSVSIIGIGALGQTLARALHEKGFRLQSLFNRTAAKADRLGKELDVAITGEFPSSAQQLGELTFITATDGMIEVIAGELAAKLQNLSEKTFVHCSGNETYGILVPLKKNEARIAAFHPLQTFNTESKPGVFRDIYISLEGEEEAIEELKAVATALGAHPLPITAEAKSYLHASAVVASNYLITLMQLSGDIAELGGIDHRDARNALHTLVKTTVENSTAADLSSVLSGPIARGDLDTVEKHLGLLEQNAQIKALYKQLGLATVDLALKKGKLTGEQANQLRDILGK